MKSDSCTRPKRIDSSTTLTPSQTPSTSMGFLRLTPEARFHLHAHSMRQNNDALPKGGLCSKSRETKHFPAHCGVRSEREREAKT